MTDGRDPLRAGTAAYGAIADRYTCGAAGCECRAAARRSRGTVHCPLCGALALRIEVRGNELRLGCRDGCPWTAIVDAVRRPGDSVAFAPIRALAPPHRQVLEGGSAISPEVVEERGYWTATDWRELDGLQFRGTQKRPECFPALVIPQHGPDGDRTYAVLRYDRPRTRHNGGIIKYEQPQGIGLRLDVPPRCVDGLRDPARALWWTEGAKKADALASVGLVAVNTPGVDGWRSPSAIPDLYGIPLKGRAVVCAYDSDVLSKPAVRQAVEALARWLALKGAEVCVLDWRRAELPPDGKLGVDDYLATGRGRADLEALVVPFADWLEGMRDTAPRVPYRADDDGLRWLKVTRDGPVPVPLTNFAARIVADVAEDDGAEVRRLFEIEARLGGRAARFAVPAEKFGAMGWPTEHLGAGAIVYPGMGTKDHARAAIQLLSGDVPTSTIYRHTGLRRVGGAWAYLHAGGAIGPDGPLPGVEVHLPEALARFRFPPPPVGERLVAVVRASLGMLRVGPKRVTVPVFGATYRASLGTADFGLHLVGPTGAGKTEIAALGQQHYGPGMDARNLPAAWWSTGNSLEALAFAAKDALLVIDDFCPTGSAADVQRYHREADRVFRAQGNAAGRQRLRADATLKAARPPRGLIGSTGEDVPRGQSLRSRVLILEVGPKDLDWSLLSACQRDAADGLYAEALVGFVGWVVGRYDELRTHMRAEAEELRAAAYRADQHRRTPGIVADLAVGLRCFLRFAHDVGAISRAEGDALWAAWWAALGEAARSQGQHQGASEPTRRFLELLGAAITAGAAHVAAPSGDEPEIPVAWGWREVAVGAGEYQRSEWRPQGARVGWVDGEDLYLEPDAAYAAVQRLARDGGDAPSVTPQTLWKRLRERGVLRSVDQKRQTLKIRRTFERRQHDVLHLHAASLLPPTEPDKPDNAGKTAPSDGTTGAGMSGSMSGSEANPTGNPTPNGATSYLDEDGNVGFVGFSPGEDGHAANGRANHTGPMSGGTENPTPDPTGNPTSVVADAVEDL